MKHAHLPLTSLKVLFLLSILVSSASYAQAAGALSATFRDEGRPFTLKDGVAYVDDQNGKTVLPYCRPARGALRKAQDSAARQGRTPTCPKKSKLTFVDAETKEPVAADRGASEFSRIFISLAPRVVGRTTDADKNKLLAVILVKSSGGSGTYSYIAVANPKSHVGTNLVLLGDRVKVKQVQAKGNIVTVEYLDRPAAAPMSAVPTIKTVRRFQFTGEELAEVSETTPAPDATPPAATEAEPSPDAGAH